MFRRLILLLLMLIVTIPIIAQEDEPEAFNRLPEMLQNVPDTEASRQWFTFADYEAMTLARAGAVRPATLEAFESDLPPYRFWWAAFMGIQSGVALDFARLWWNDGDTVNGFTFFEMDGSVQYGSPTEQVQMFLADYDPDKVIAAHADRDYTVEETDSYQLLCSPDGCDAGQQVNVADRDPTYIFGGHLGRKQPVLMYDNIILSSPYMPAVEAHRDVVTGDAPSLADDADYRALAEAAGVGVEAIIQGYILPVSVIATTEDVIASMLGADATEDEREAMIEQLGLDDAENNLPAYAVFAITDAATATEQVARVMLPYDNETNAEIAADEMQTRLESMTSVMTRRDFVDVLEDRNATMTSYIIATDDRFVAVLELRAPLAVTIENNAGLINASSMLYRIFPTMIFSGDTLWLAPNLPQQED